VGRAIGWIALLLFVATLLIHFATYAGLVLLAPQHLWPLMACVMVVFLPAGLRMPVGRILGLERVSLKGYPRWILAAAAALVLYALANFFLGMKYIEHNPNPGWAFSLRLFSGHLLIFLLAPVLVFLRPRAAPK